MEKGRKSEICLCEEPPSFIGGWFFLLAVVVARRGCRLWDCPAVQCEAEIVGSHGGRGLVLWAWPPLGGIRKITIIIMYSQNNPD